VQNYFAEIFFAVLAAGVLSKNTGFLVGLSLVLRDGLIRF
jgi:hypothetical protein